MADTYIPHKGDMLKGREVLQEYFNMCVLEYGMKISFDEFLRRAASGLRGRVDLVTEDIGWNIRILEARSGQVEDAMSLLAEQYQDTIPPHNAFSMAIARRIQNVSATDYFFGSPQILKGIASDVGSGLARGGNAVLDVFKTFEVIGPILIVGAIIYIGYMRTKKLA